MLSFLLSYSSFQILTLFQADLIFFLFIKSKISILNLQQILLIETTIDSSRNFKSKELKDSKNTQAHTGKILSLFKLEKYYAASCSEDKQIKVWNWRTGKLKKIFKTDRPCKSIFGVNEFLIGVEGNMMIVINWKNKKVENISTHSCEISLVRPVKSRKDRVDRIILVDIQNIVHLYRFDMRAKCFQYERELLKWEMPNDFINNCLSLSDTQVILSTGNSGYLIILNWINSREEKRFNVQEINNGIADMDMSHNGILCMMTHPQRNNYILISCKSGAFGVWDIERGILALKIAQFASPIITMDRQSLNQIVISDGKDYQLLSIQQVLNFSSKKQASYHFNDINFILHLDDEFFLTSDITGRLRIWQIEQPYLLPDRAIGTASHPVFNILQCPELNSLDNSLSSAAGYSSNKKYQNGQGYNNEGNQTYQQQGLYQQNEYGSHNQSPQIQQNYNLNIYQQEQTNQIQNQDNQNIDQQLSIRNIINSQESSQHQAQQTPHLQQSDNEQEQTFSNSKFGNDSHQENNNQYEQQKEILQSDQQQDNENVQDFQIKEMNLQKHTENILEYDDHTPQFNPNSAGDSLLPEKPHQQKIKMLNLEEAFNIKRKELEQQQQTHLNGVQPISSLYSLQSQNYPGSNLQQLEGRLTSIQNQIIQSDRSVESEFSLYKHNRKNSREEDHEILQPDSEFLDKQGGEQETLCLNDNINEIKGQQQLQTNNEGEEREISQHPDYNSIVSNASEQYLASIHSHLAYPNREQTQIQQNNQTPQNKQIDNTQLSNMINIVNQKLRLMNEETQLQSSVKSNQDLKAPQKTIPIISQQEAMQLRQELENLSLKINEYKRLNDSLDVNYQIVAKKLSIELEKSEKEKKQVQEMAIELEKQKQELSQQRVMNSKLEEEIRQINQKHEEELQQMRVLNFSYEEALQQQNMVNAKYEEEIRLIEQNYRAEVMQREKLQLDNQNIIKKNDDLNQQIQSLQIEMQSILAGQANTNQENKKLIQENSDLLREISNITKEKQNIFNQNESLVKKNEHLVADLNCLTKEKQSLTLEAEELRKINSNSKKELISVQKECTRLQQECDTTSREVSSLKLQIENNRFSQQNGTVEFIEKVNKLINDQASDKNLIDLTECIKRSGLSAKELEVVQKNIYDKQIKNLYNQIEEQQRENQRVLMQFQQMESANSNLISDIENQKKENERLKSDIRRTKDSLEHWVKQYSVLLDREKLQLKNIESKEELILLLKQEIEKLNSLYQQQLQDQLNQNGNINPNNNIYEQCRKELLLDEWNSLLSLIENESMAQFSRIEQTNRKSEKISIIPQLSANQNQTKHQFQPVNSASQIKQTPPQKDLKSPQNSQQIFITNDLQVSYQISNANNNQPQQQTPLSQIPQNIPFDKKQNYQYQQQYNSNQTVKDQKNIQQSIDFKNNQAASLYTQPQQNIPSQSIQSSVSPNYQSNQISSSPSSSIKNQADQNQMPNHQRSKVSTSINGTIASQANLQSNYNTEQHSNKQNSISYQSNQPQQSYQSQSTNNQTPTNNNQKNTLTINLSSLQQRSFQQNHQQHNDNSPLNQGNSAFSNSNVQYQPNNLSHNNNSIHLRSKSDNNQIDNTPYSAKFNKQENITIINQAENTPMQSDLNREYRSKSPQSVNNQLSTQNIINQTSQQPQLSSGTNTTSSNNLLPEKSDRQLSGLQNLKNMKKNISLTNVSSQPISTLNITPISPSQYNDQPSEFIRRQIEHQQYVQYIDKKNYESLRSLTPQPAKTQLGLGYQPINTQPQKQNLTDLGLSNTSNNNNIIRRDTFDPQQNKTDKTESTNYYSKNYSSLSPMGRVSTTPVTGSIGEKSKQISFTPTPSIKKQKIQEALKMTYVNKEEQITSNMIQQNNYEFNNNQSNLYHNQRCKTEEPHAYDNIQDNYLGNSVNAQQQIQSGPSYNNPVSPVNHRDNLGYNAQTPTSQIKQNSYNNLINQNSQSQISPLHLRYDSKHSISQKALNNNQTDQKQQNFQSDYKQSNTSPMLSQQKNSNQNQVFMHNKTNVAPLNSYNIITQPQYSNSKNSNNNEQDIIITKLNFDYVQNQNQHTHPSSQSPYTPSHSQGDFFSQKKATNQSSSLNCNNPNTQQNIQQNHLQNTNSKTNFQYVTDQKNELENINDNLSKKPSYRTYSINSQSNQKNLE